MAIDFYREEARKVIAILAFLSKAYNKSNERLAEIEADLAEKNMSLQLLHNEFYCSFEKALCKG